MVANSILRSTSPEVDDIRIVAKGQNPGFWDIILEEVLCPEDASTFVCPGCLTISSQAMNENDTLFISQVEEEEKDVSSMDSLHYRIATFEALL